MRIDPINQLLHGKAGIVVHRIFDMQACGLEGRVPAAIRVARLRKSTMLLAKPAFDDVGGRMTVEAWSLHFVDPLAKI